MINKDLVIKNLNYEWRGENGTYSFDGVTFSIQENFLNMYNGKQGKLVSYDTVLNRTDELKKILVVFLMLMEYFLMLL